MDEWAAALSFLVLSGIVGVSMIFATWVLGVKARRDMPLKRRTYECGEEPDGPAWVKFHPRYYVVALIFVLFDVEAVFLFPWSLVIRELGLLAIVEMCIFVAVLLLGWLYALRKGALRWQ
jgi:NADH:ubiquinone oxidoreductase subunit 3 (subunit A)